MKSFDYHDAADHYSPLASTEEKSIYDYININKQSLEKGLKNRPNCNVLVDRGILRNPGKAYSDKMSQLDLAKRRDKLRIKIANRPERDELVRKLILPEQNDNRQKEFDRIKELLDDSINNRPGSLELVDKRILQVDRLLASRIQSGDITYPKVCGDGNFSDSLSSNHSTPLPSISEIDIHNSLNELSDLKSTANLTNSKSNLSRNLQYSYKKTYRVGRYSFHNIEFRPSAQKAREYQQNQLVQFEEIQAQRNPSLKKIHSELATKSQHNNENVMSEPCCVTPKHSLLHRLNVHELKSECKIRMISCSNIPKVQLVEKLLPYESEILASHTSFDSSNRNSNLNQSNRRSMPVIKSNRDFSPPETNSNMGEYYYESNQSPGQLVNHNIGSTDSSKMIHSLSEPLIPNYMNNAQSVSLLNRSQIFPISAPVQNSNYNVVKVEDRCYGNQISSFNQFATSNSYSALNCSQSNIPVNIEHFSPSHNIIMQPSVYDTNGWGNLNKASSQLQNCNSSVLQTNFFHQQSAPVDPQTDMYFAQYNFDCNSSSNFHPPKFNIPSPSQIGCGNKFDVIVNDVSNLLNFINKVKLNTSENNAFNSSLYIDQFDKMIINVRKLINEMNDFINKEIKFKTIDFSTAQIQQNWLNALLIFVENECQLPIAESFKMESDYSDKVSDDMTNNNNGLHYLSYDHRINGQNQLEKINIDQSDSFSDHKSNEFFYLDPLSNDYIEDLDQFNLNKEANHGSPSIDFVNSPLCNFELDDIMNDLLNVT